MQQADGEIEQSQSTARRKITNLAEKIENFNTAKKGIIARVLRYLPASLNLIFGALIMSFLALPAVGGMFAMLTPQPGYALIGDFSIPDASVGVIFLLICGIAYLGLGGLKMLWAYKKPFYKNNMVSAISVALMAAIRKKCKPNQKYLLL